MSLNQDDPNLTAAALGEIPTAEQPARFRDEAHSREIEQITAMAGLLETGLSRELLTPPPEESASSPVVIEMPLWRRSGFWALSVAAALTFGGLALLLQLPTRPVTTVDASPEAEGGLRVRLDASLFNREDGGVPSSVSRESRKWVRPRVHDLDASPVNIAMGPGIGPLVPEPGKGSSHEPARAPVPRGLIRTDEGLFVDARFQPYASFPLQVADASYQEAARRLEEGNWPAPETVLPEEFLNAFDYRIDRLPDRVTAGPVVLATEWAPCPWNPDHRLIEVVTEARHSNGVPQVSLALDFNPDQVSRYRLLWSETGSQSMARSESTGRKEGLWTGDQVVAFYEVVPLEKEWMEAARRRGDLRTSRRQERGTTAPWLRVGLEVHQGHEAGQVQVLALTEPMGTLEEASGEFRFGAAVASFSLRLRGEISEDAMPLSEIREMARSAVGEDSRGRRGRFVDLVDRAALIRS